MIQPIYKHAVLATDIIILTIREGALCVLLIKMKKAPFENMWAAPGGLVKPEESVDTSAMRNLEATTGVKDVYLEQLYTFGRVDRDPFGRVVSVAYYALNPNPDILLRTTSNYAGIGWFDVKQMPALAYDHEEMIQYAVERLQAKLAYTNVVYSLLPKHFTLTELQTTYEIILGRKLDKRNFRKKIQAAGIVRKTELKTQGRASRPAALYRFASRKFRVVQLL